MLPNTFAPMPTGVCIRSLTCNPLLSECIFLVQLSLRRHHANTESNRLTPRDVEDRIAQGLTVKR
jgi:hypothetical protein